MKINRLLEITLILLNKKTVTAEEMAERFGVSTRTIYPDIDELSSAGVPVFANHGKGGGLNGMKYSVEFYDQRYQGDKNPKSVVGCWVPISAVKG
jgi:transcriptional antiterminator